MEAILDAGAAVRFGAAVARREHVCAGARCWRWRGRTARRRPARCWLDPRACRARPRVPDRRRATGLRSFGAQLAPTRLFVIEADEYDTAFFDKRSKFVHYLPRTAVLNNLEFDHADIFPDLGAIETQFHHFVRMRVAVGRVVVQRRRAGARARTGARLLVATGRAFGVGGAGSCGSDRGRHARIRLLSAAHLRRTASLTMPGHHNRCNALAAIVAAEHVGVAPARRDRGAAALPGSQAPAGGARPDAAASPCIDDFAHHPTAIATTVGGAAAQRSGTGRILAVLEPRSNTMKLGAMRAAAARQPARRPISCSATAHATARSVGWNLAEALAPLGARGPGVRRSRLRW